MQIIFSKSTLSTFNLAAEEFLFSEHKVDLLFLYVNEPSVIVGCNQAVRNEVDLGFCAQNEIRIIRRMSGGGTVFHDPGNLNFCFISNKNEGKSSLNNDFLLPIVEVLTNSGIQVEIGKRKDLWIEGKHKITGTASHVAKNRELHHGTLLYNTNLEMLEKALNSKTKDESVKAIASVRSTVKNLRTWLEEKEHFTLDANEFFDLLTTKLQLYFNLESVTHFTETEISQIKILEKSKYSSEEWTYKK